MKRKRKYDFWEILSDKKRNIFHFISTIPINILNSSEYYSIQIGITHGRITKTKECFYKSIFTRKNCDYSSNFSLT